MNTCDNLNNTKETYTCIKNIATTHNDNGICSLLHKVIKSSNKESINMIVQKCKTTNTQN